MEIIGSLHRSDIVVSVFCITYNQEKYIRETIDGILSQKAEFNFEILIHDDASTDKTRQIVKEYAEKNPERITAILQSENQFSKGVSPFRDILPKYAHGKYIAVCEGDDYWIDQMKLQMQYEAMEKNLDCSISVHTVQGKSENLQKDLRKYPRVAMNQGVIEADEVMYWMLERAEWLFQTSSYFVRSAIMDEIYFQKPESISTNPYGDEAFLRFCASKGNFYFIDRVMSVYRMGAEGSTVDRTRKSKYKKGFYTKKIESLKLFNKESNFKFDLLVRNNIKRWEFVLCREEKNFKKMLSKEMSCFFAELPFHVKAYVLISSRIPVFDSFYYWLRKKIKGY